MVLAVTTRGVKGAFLSQRLVVSYAGLVPRAVRTPSYLAATLQVRDGEEMCWERSGRDDVGTRANTRSGFLGGRGFSLAVCCRGEWCEVVVVAKGRGNYI